MIRAAAKNHSHVAVVVDPSDYDELLQHLAGDVSTQQAVQYRKRLAWKAFQHCATYDSTVAEWLWSQIGEANFSHCSMFARTLSGIMCRHDTQLQQSVQVLVVLHVAICICRASA